MNFNFNSQPEYQLNEDLTLELISLYGILTKFVKTEKINVDSSVFGDFSHMKSNNTDIYDIYMMPENTEDWDTGGYNFGPFDLVNTDNVTLFCPRSSFEFIAEPNQIVGNLLVFPNNKVMEIVDINVTVPGINNIFTHNDAKNVYSLVCKPYSFKLAEEIDQFEISQDQGEFESLESYFNELTNNKTEQDTDNGTTPQVISVDKNGVDDLKVEKPIIDKSESSVWGNYD